jgi:GPH family glycoside/pentoside/hexuronide:cation symporter
MGNIVDRVHTKWGKIKHWFLWTCIPIGLTIGLMFMAPVSGSDTVKLVWAMIIYNLYCTCLTAARMPAYAIPSVCSDNPQVRLFLVWISSYGTNIAATITGWIITPFVGGFADALTGYRALAWVLGGVTVVGLVIVFLCLSEKRTGADLEIIEEERKELRREAGKKNAEKSMSLREQYGYLFRNKYWIGYQISGLCNSFSLSFMIGTMAIYAIHILGGAGIGGNNPMGILTTIMNIPMMIAPLLILPFSKKVDAKTLVVVLMLVGGIVTGVQWALGIANWVPWVVCMVVAQSAGSCCNGCSAVLLTRAIDYGEWKFGVRQEGVGSSFSSSLNKIAAGICTALLGILLGAAGYSQENGLPESGKAIVIFMFIGMPCIARILGGVCYQFLSMGNKEWTKIRAELDERHAADAAKREG